MTYHSKFIPRTANALPPTAAHNRYLVLGVPINIEWRSRTCC